MNLSPCPGRGNLRARVWLAAAVVVVGVAFAGQALSVSGAAELQQTFKAAKQSGENLVEVLRLALQSGANLADVAAAAEAAGIGADIVAEAALAAGQASPDVARAVAEGAGTELGYLYPTVAGVSGAPEVLPGARSGGGQPHVMGNLKPCPPGHLKTPASGPNCCCRSGYIESLCSGSNARLCD